ncbi:aldose 1-epimerase family protein [Agrilactobacillus yilanensis]|uniref:Aldose 1-epimerase family protein n=1 Tax=Agrilactobacillus yilanensis TaxID=2485997 RepID=A0ABW4J8G4_9LACO|nr:aldose 1-epimerase family protein [Agrilactobacillus yilanensis]
MQTIENGKFKAVIDEKGAQLTHLYNKAEDFDYIWNNDIWPKHAPVLFPAIGRSNDDSYFYEGKKYEMPQHGFVSEYEFNVAKKSEDSVTLALAANDEMKKIYPFDFKLEIVFTLKNDGLHWDFNVSNEGQNALSFSLGSHPAFNVPINGKGEFSDYKLEVTPKVDALEHFKIVKKPYPFREGHLETIKDYHNGAIDLNYDMFADGLIILENKGIDALKLTSAKTEHTITVTLKDFRYVCLWTKEGADAPFLCIEPFEGLPDVYGEPVDIMEKEGNVKLAANENKTFSYDIKL